MGGGTEHFARVSGRVLLLGFVVIVAIAILPIEGRGSSSPAAGATPALIASGQNPGALAGRAVALADLNGDGQADLIVGAPSDPSGGTLAGQVLIFLGGSSHSTPDITINGSSSERFGWSVANAGDVDGNGVDDLLVGAPFNDSAARAAGAAYLFLGWKGTAGFPDWASRANVTILGTAGGQEFGYSVGAAGDVNLDGYADIAIGAPTAGSGFVSVYFGGKPMDSTPDKTFMGAAAGDGFGTAFAGGANVDGDPSPDLAVGAPGSDSGRGSVAVILNVRRASPKIVSLAGESTGDRFGTSLAMADFNDDGFADVAVGAPMNGASGTAAGRAYLYFGSALQGKFDSTPDRIFHEGIAGDQFGAALGSGDPRTDGIPDLLVGAPFNDTGGSDAGAEYVFYGNASADTAPDLVAVGTGAADEFGFSVASGSSKTADFNGDLAADFAAGAPLHGPQSQGAAYLYLGTRVVVPAKPTLFGYVLDNVTKRGIGNALVSIQSASLAVAVRTTANGSYGIAAVIAVPPGSYWINGTSPTYFPASTTRSLAFDTRTNVSLNLTRLPVVHGTIRDGNVSTLPPLSGATVVATNGTGARLGSTTTDSSGAYFLRLSQKGAITITASKAGYFDNATSFAIREDQNLTKDLVLQHMPILRVRVTDGGSSPPGANLAGVTVVVAIRGATVASGTTDRSGNVTLVVKGQGSAWINATKSGYIPGSVVQTLVQNRTKAVELSLDRFPNLSGDVRDGLTGAAIRGSTVDLRFHGNRTAVRSTTTDSRGTYTFTALPVDTYDVRATAIGYLRSTRMGVALGPNDASFVDFALVPDTTPPTSSVTSPAPASVITTFEFAVAATASDPNGNDIIQVELWYGYNNGTFAKAGTDTTAPYSFTFNVSQAKGDGRYAFYTLATDAAGNVEPVPTANDTWVLVDALPPVSHASALPSYANATSFPIAATASDDVGVREVELWYNKDGGAYAKVGTASSAPYGWTFATTLGDGAYGFYTIAVDIAGNREAAPTAADAQTTVDTVGPVVTILAPISDTWFAASAVTVTWTASDSGSGVASIQARVDGGTWHDAAGGSTAVASLADGPHTVDVRATDRAGNARTASVSFRVDTVPPTLTITAPSTGSTVSSGNVTVTWTASDTGSGIDRYEVRVDTGSFASIGTAQSATFPNLGGGSHSVTVRAYDVAGNVREASTTFTVPQPVQPLGVPTVVLIGGSAVFVVAIVALAVWVARRRKARPPA